MEGQNLFFKQTEWVKENIMDKKHYYQNVISTTMKHAEDHRKVVKEFGRFIWRDLMRGHKTSEKEMQRIMELGWNKEFKFFFKGWEEKFKSFAGDDNPREEKGKE